MWWILLFVVFFLIPFIIWRHRLLHSPKNYMWRAQSRLKRVSEIEGEIQAGIESGTITTRRLLALEGQLYSIWKDQSKERTPHPPVMDRHRDGYAKMMEFSFRRVKDFRETGGANIERINAESDAFLSRELGDKAMLSTDVI